jgi:thioredoxin-like negative regulator of GroEL
MLQRADAPTAPLRGDSLRRVPFMELLSYVVRTDTVASSKEFDMAESAEERILQKIRSAQSLVVYFSTPTCNVCKVLRPKVEQLVGEHPGVEFLYVDSSLFPAVAGQHVVFAVPTLVLFMEGREQRRFSRNLSIADFERALSHMQP